MTQESFLTNDAPMKALADRKAEEDFVSQVMYGLAAPIVLYPGWEESFKDQRTEVSLQRMARQNEVHRDRACTEYEAMLYLSSASLCFPLSASWTEAYLWLFNRCLPKAAEADPDLRSTRELDQDQQEELLKLRRWIYKKQLLHMTEKGKAGQRQEVQRLKKEVEAEQPKLL